ncbi:hypothetical protein BZL30_6213 [Mycobacterium kansasii]|uniref:Uncharacterized protein n=1 Tax=Mycobacterium kansasii TaxID=1768 RepID=A0A1V3WTR8_MYCKA|nr:hypothetical protein BZL30_6213 [Mycobacterium kansasii]
MLSGAGDQRALTGSAGQAIEAGRPAAPVRPRRRQLRWHCLFRRHRHQPGKAR